MFKCLPGCLTLVAALSLSGCAWLSTLNQTDTQPTRYTALDESLVSRLGFDSEFVRIVHFNLHAAPARILTGMERSPRDGETSVVKSFPLEPSGARSLPDAGHAKSFEPAGDDWLFRLAPDHTVIQLFSTRRWQTAQRELTRLKIDGHLFYSPSGWWITLYDDSFPTMEAARERAEEIAHATDGDFILRPVGQLQRGRCANRQHQAPATANHLDQLCDG